MSDQRGECFHRHHSSIGSSSSGGGGDGDEGSSRLHHTSALRTQEQEEVTSSVEVEDRSIGQIDPDPVVLYLDTPGGPDTSCGPRTDLQLKSLNYKILQHQEKNNQPVMEQKTSQSPASTSPQRQMKSRSKSTEEMQHSRKAFSSQKSLPGRPELDKVKECFEGADTPLSSTEELK